MSSLTAHYTMPRIRHGKSQSHRPWQLCMCSFKIVTPHYCITIWNQLCSLYFNFLNKLEKFTINHDIFYVSPMHWQRSGSFTWILASFSQRQLKLVHPLRSNSTRFAKRPIEFGSVFKLLQPLILNVFNFGTLLPKLFGSPTKLSHDLKSKTSSRGSYKNEHVTMKM